jgi:hypothetical protein
LWFRGSPSRNPSEFKDSWYKATDYVLGLDVDMSYMVKRTAHFQASDPRDMLFTLLYLARDTRELMHVEPRLSPDYEKPVMDVILDFWQAGIHLDFVVRPPPLVIPNTSPTSTRFVFALWYDDDDHSKEIPDPNALSFIPGFDYPL